MGRRAEGMPNGQDQHIGDPSTLTMGKSFEEFLVHKQNTTVKMPPQKQLNKYDMDPAAFHLFCLNKLS